LGADHLRQLEPSPVLTLPNGATVAYGYDADSRVTGLTYSASNIQLGTLSYTYDDAGRRLTSFGSLAAVTLPTNVAGGSSKTYNADNEQTAFNGTTFSFDANGNLIGDGTYSYIYGSRNQLN